MSDLTKQDLESAISALKVWIVERENAWIKWVIGIQLSYFVVTLGLVYFALGRH